MSIDEIGQPGCAWPIITGAPPCERLVVELVVRYHPDGSGRTIAVPLCHKHAKMVKPPTMAKARRYHATMVINQLVMMGVLVFITYTAIKVWWQRSAYWEWVLVWDAVIVLAYLIFFLPRAIAGARDARPCLAHIEGTTHVCTVHAGHRTLLVDKDDPNSRVVRHMCSCGYAWPVESGQS